MRCTSPITAVCTLVLFHLADFATGFSSGACTSTSSRVLRAGVPPAAESRGLRMGPAPGLWKRKLPNGLGSWRVESVVDQQEPTSLFVFLFDDGSGEVFSLAS